MSNVGVFVDLALAAVLLIALVMGWRQGFVQALTRILVVVAALLLAGWIAGKLAEPAARWLEPVLTEKLEQRLTAQGNTSDAGEMLAAFGFEGDTLSKLVDSAVQKAQQAGETLLSAVVSTALRSAAYAVVYVVSFLLLLVVLRLALSPLHLFTKLPVVHGVNALLGGALGLVKGALLVFLGWRMRGDRRVMMMPLQQHFQWLRPWLRHELSRVKRKERTPLKPKNLNRPVRLEKADGL